MYTQLTGSEQISAPTIATESQNRLSPKLPTCADRFARLEGVLGGLRDQLLDAADRQITAQIRPHFERDDDQQRNNHVISRQLDQQPSCTHRRPPI
jgi:predicted rRNA methylase YqxC with S4 and FtsJ domains